MIFDEPPGSRAHFVEPEIDSRLEIEDHDLAVQLAERDVRIDRHHGGQRGPAHWHRSSHRIFHTHGVKSRERAPACHRHLVYGTMGEPCEPGGSRAPLSSSATRTGCGGKIPPNTAGGALSPSAAPHGPHPAAPRTPDPPGPP